MKHISSEVLLDKVLEPVFEIRPSKTRLSKKKLHRMRVSIKRTRARLNLIKHLAEKHSEISELNQKLKQLSRQLSSQRNLDVALELIDDLLKKNKTVMLNDELVEVQNWIEQQSGRQDLDVEVLSTLIKEIELSYLRLPSVDIRIVHMRKFIDKRLQQLCQHGESLLEKGDCTALHEWRKQVKRLYYQVEVLSGDKLTTEVSEDSLQKLGDKLGKVHDICFLKAMLQSQKESAISKASSADSLLLHFLEDQRHSLLKKCCKQYQLVCE